MSALTVSSLHAGYGAGDILKDVNLTVDDGEIVAILGANGAGKTTLMRAISGVIERRGTVDLRGTNISKYSPDAIVRLRLAQVPQGRGTLADLTVEDNLRIGAHIRRDNEIASDIERWYTVYPRLGDRRNQKAGLMSGGEQQMLAISRALMSRPTVLLLDEPSLGLSPKLTTELFASLAEINKVMGMAVLVVEQNAAIALSIANRGYLMETGVLSSGKPASELANDKAVKAAYLGG